MTLEEAIIADMSDAIHAQLTDIVNRAYQKGYDLAKSELIHCKDCKYFNGDDHYCDFNVVAISEGYCYLAERKEE